MVRMTEINGINFNEFEFQPNKYSSFHFFEDFFGVKLLALFVNDYNDKIGFVSGVFTKDDIITVDILLSQLEVRYKNILINDWTFNDLIVYDRKEKIEKIKKLIKI